jgi:phosphoribosylformimino-5-aminoimidazole carboxamide ribotide isomerase
MRIIPAIDILDGKCVRLTKGDYSTQKVYSENPVEMAKQFEDHGIMFLHLVDLDGAKSQHLVNHKVLEGIATQTKLKIDFGGGIKSQADIETAFACGASQVTGGSIAIQDPLLFLDWLKVYGNDRIILGADAKNRNIATQGWLEESRVDVVDFISEFVQKGISYVVCTDIAKDGMLQGPSNRLYQEILRRTTVNLVASGGVTTMEDLKQLKAIGCEAAIVGKALYEGKISLLDLAKEMGNGELKS